MRVEGTGTATCFGDSLSRSQANFGGDTPYGNGSDGPIPGRGMTVGSYAANGWGLFDMHGNVAEWCSDVYTEKLSGGLDPKGAVPRAESVVHRVMRGGSWRTLGRGCRSANRPRYTPGYHFDCMGFRLARTLPSR